MLKSKSFKGTGITGVALLLFVGGLFAQTPTWSRAELLADLDTLTFQLSAVHPTWNENNKGSLAVEAVKNNVTDNMSQYDFFLLLQPIITVDGHTSLQYRGKIHPEMKTPYLPLQLLCHDKNWYIAANYSANPIIRVGARLLGLNDSDIDEVVNKLLQYVPGETRRYKMQKLTDRFANFYRLVYGNHAEFVLHLENGDVVVQGVAGDQLSVPAGPVWQLQLLDDQTACLTIRRFRQSEKFLAFIDSSFTVLQQKRIQNLIIDNRRGGGFTTLADSVISYLTDKPYSTFERMETKISPLTADYVSENAVHGESKNQWFIREYKSGRPVRRANRFKGRVFLLTGRRAYSTATLFAAVLKCNNIAEVVGEETGQPLISNGNISLFTLPNTGLRCISSNSIMYMPCAVDREHGVMPDHPVTATLADHLAGKDTDLQFTLELIRSTN